MTLMATKKSKTHTHKNKKIAF